MIPNPDGHGARIDLDKLGDGPVEVNPPATIPVSVLTGFLAPARRPSSPDPHRKARLEVAVSKRVREIGVDNQLVLATEKTSSS